MFCVISVLSGRDPVSMTLLIAGGESRLERPSMWVILVPCHQKDTGGHMHVGVLRLSSSG